MTGKTPPKMRIHHVTPERFTPRQWIHAFNRSIPGGDIAEAYNITAIAEGGAVHPFTIDLQGRGDLWTCVEFHGRSATAYRLVPVERFKGTPTTFEERCKDSGRTLYDPLGFFHGIQVQHQGRSYALCGPPHQFKPAPPEPPETPEAGRGHAAETNTENDTAPFGLFAVEP
jgi:hypothetical protein